MALRSNLALWCYSAPGAPGPVNVADYGAEIEGLEFTTVAPGGFGDLACILKLPDARGNCATSCRARAGTTAI